MPVLFQSGAGPVSSIVNYFSDGGVGTGYAISAGTGNNCLPVFAGGAYTANTLQTIISHTGRGRVNFLTVYQTNGTSRTMRMKVTVDGTVIFDATSASALSSGSGMVVVGTMTTSSAVFQPIDYQESLLIEVASSLSEAAANVGIGVNREVWAS